MLMLPGLKHSRLHGKKGDTVVSPSDFNLMAPETPLAAGIFGHFPTPGRTRARNKFGYDNVIMT